MRLFAIITAAFLSLTSVALADNATQFEVDNGCPAQLPVVAVANSNVVVLDRTNLSKDCLRAIYIQNGDDKGGNDDDDNSSK